MVGNTKILRLNFLNSFIFLNYEWNGEVPRFPWHSEGGLRRQLGWKPGGLAWCQLGKGRGDCSRREWMDGRPGRDSEVPLYHWEVSQPNWLEWFWHKCYHKCMTWSHRHTGGHPYSVPFVMLPSGPMHQPFMSSNKAQIQTVITLPKCPIFALFHRSPRIPCF